jgi:hypothetical protein
MGVNANHGVGVSVHLLLVIKVACERASGRSAIHEVCVSVLAWGQKQRRAKRRRAAPSQAQAMVVAHIQRQQEEQMRTRGRVALRTLAGTRKQHKTLLAPSCTVR